LNCRFNNYSPVADSQLNPFTRNIDDVGSVPEKRYDSDTFYGYVSFVLANEIAHLISFDKIAHPRPES